MTADLSIVRTVYVVPDVRAAARDHQTRFSFGPLVVANAAVSRAGETRLAVSTGA